MGGHLISRVLAALVLVAVCLQSPCLAADSLQVSGQATKPTVAVLTLDASEGVSKDQALLLSDRLSIEIDRADTFTLINRSKMAEQLELNNFSRLESCRAAECAVEAGRILGATHMIYGSIGKIGETYSLNTYLIAVESGATLQSVSTDSPGDIDQMLVLGLAKNAEELTRVDVSLESGDSVYLPTCAVLTYDPRGGISDDEIRIFSDRIAIELDHLDRFTLVPRSKMSEILEEQKFSRSEDCTVSDCAIEAGRLLGVRYMIYGSIGRIGRLFTINSYMIDVESGAAVLTANTDYVGEKEQLLVEGMRSNVESLLDGKKQANVPANILDILKSNRPKKAPKKLPSKIPIL